ncbi:hypothetical protein [Planktothrix agardhii]|uniref:hypothetical protein n=2 Tax=Planktothrix agardhii TaxID=1160 RepID=UPI001D0BAB2D|nr:hypothetical protein [Planktothrix agardhii]MCB8788184.1 hypothetical protein [Planktothrix agardhii 1025]MCF3610048.1 hypothetical protein [Planktothrix agardhii 1027]MCF3643646.1 hypothetical protein [Planktothrix agardhii 1026]
MKYKNIREEELKNKVGADWFKQFDTTEILGNIDFTVFPKNDSLFGRTPLLWAEAKTGNFDVPTMFVQLILTIGKARTFDKTLPPAFLGAFDFKKIAFVEYSNVQDIFYLNDFNWNVTPSNHETKEFRLIKERIESTLKENTYVFDFEKDDKELRTFIKDNIANATTISKIKIDKNNFIPIYLRWIETVKPIINVNWEELKKANILDSDFYLADLFVDDKDTQNIEDDSSIRDNLFVVFQNQGYKIAKENLKQMFDATINIKNKDIYSQFWKLYKRPPLKEFQDYIIERRDLLTPQDIRERKGAFFTPRIWVELSQKYLTDYLGENWQDDYTIWDCAAGTGNLLAGLTNKYNIYASTLDQADVNVMHERIEHGANLLKNHVFQFDFLNDDFTKLPQSLQDIINDEEKRKKLVIYINPPYAESGDAKQKHGTGENKAGTAKGNNINIKYSKELGRGKNELFVQFLIRIFKELPSVKIANFSKLKNLQSPAFKEFRNNFNAKLENLFIAPADTFDNVKGQFPIGFFIWNSDRTEIFNEILADVYNKNSEFIKQKLICSYDKEKNIGVWFNRIRNKENHLSIGMMESGRNDFQHNNLINIQHNISTEKSHAATINFTLKNLIPCCVFFSVRLSIEATWLNDRDQFLYPNDNWENDTEFQNDCLAYTLFHGQNRITSKEGTNHWIPFTEQEVNAQNKFESHFMTDFINGKIKVEEEVSLFGSASSPNQKREFSVEAKAVFDAGRELWGYYHKQPNVNVNASLYDIREYFQGRNDKDIMNSKSDDAHYMQLIGELRNQLNFLADKIKPKIYEYEFLKE